MSEFYYLHTESGHLKLLPGESAAPDWLNGSRVLTPPKGWVLVCRMGDPDLVHCAVLKNEAKAGGLFQVFDKHGALFTAEALSNLAFAMGMGYFGSLTANARYGVDVYENMEEPDD